MWVPDREGSSGGGMQVSTLQPFLLTVSSWLLCCWALSEVAQTGTGLAEKKGLIYTSGQAFYPRKAIPDLRRRGGGVG